MPLLDNVAVSELEQHCLPWVVGFPRVGSCLPSPSLLPGFVLGEAGKEAPMLAAASDQVGNVAENPSCARGRALHPVQQQAGAPWGCAAPCLSPGCSKPLFLSPQLLGSLSPSD